MGHGLDPVQEVGASRGDTQNNRTSAFEPSRVSPCLMVIGTLDLEDLKAPYLSTSMFEIVWTRWRGVIWIPTPEILPRLKISFGTSCGGKLSEFLESFRCSCFVRLGVKTNLVWLTMGVDSPVKKRWGIFGVPLEETYLDLHVSRRGYVSAKVTFVCEWKCTKF